MTSLHPLPAELIGLLTQPDRTFASSAEQFRRALGEDDESWEPSFTRVCEIYNTVDLLSRSPEPIGLLAELQGTSRRTNSDVAAEDYISFILNAEFILYDLYRVHDITLNPSLAHWVTACLSHLQQQRRNGSGTDHEVARSMENLHVSFIKGILGGNAAKLAQLSPREYASAPINSTVDLESFRKALSAQGIDESDLIAASPAMQTIEHHAVPAALSKARPADSLRSEPTGEDFREIQAHLSAIIMRGTTEELGAELSKQLLAHLDSNAQLFYSLPLDSINATVLSKLFAMNRDFARGLVLLYLSKGDEDQRRQLLSALESLPTTLETLDTLNDVISKTRLLSPEDVSRLVHTTLENGIRVAENMGMAGGQMDGATDLSGFDFGNMNGSGFAAVNPLNRQAQTRQIQLLCLFIRGLLRHDAVGLQDVYYQIQDIGVKFMFVKEARELWRAYCAG